MHPPPQTLLPELEQLLATRSPSVGEAVRRVVADVRPNIRLRSERVGSGPIRGSLINRLLRRPRPAPVLPATASKFGGVPYFEREAELRGACFLGQVNFAEATSALNRQGFPVPAGMPAKGLLAIDLFPKGWAGRIRWYPDPQPRELTSPEVDPVAKYEAAIRFEGSWSLCGLDWFDAVPKEDDELWEYMNELKIPGVDDEDHGFHKLFGHANEALNEHYGLEPVPSRSDSIRDYELVWRINYDHPAGFSWGTNWLYVILHRDDLECGAFENAIVTAANA